MWRKTPIQTHTEDWLWLALTHTKVMKKRCQDALECVDYVCLSTHPILHRPNSFLLATSVSSCDSTCSKYLCCFSEESKNMNVEFIPSIMFLARGSFAGMCNAQIEHMAFAMGIYSQLIEFFYPSLTTLFFRGHWGSTIIWLTSYIVDKSFSMSWKCRLS